MKFAATGLLPDILRAIEQCGYDEMTPVQEETIPMAKSGRDLWVNAQTGTGKTAAFALPIIHRLHQSAKELSAGHVRALILTPTRELADQLQDKIQQYAQFTALNVRAVFGGTKDQSAKLKTGADVLIATPGRLVAMLHDQALDLSELEVLVLDEADRMLDMGFVESVLGINSQAPKRKQMMLFSATTTAAVNNLAHQVLNKHHEIRLSANNATADTVEHVLYPVNEEKKLDLFMELLEVHNWFQILVFTSTKKQADRLLMRLKQKDVPAALCHGDKTQGARRRALKDFKAAKIQVLVATEVAARGIDIEGLDYVLNYNLPYLPEDYVHRIGRTGRAGRLGHAISFVCPEENRALQKIERVIGQEIKRIYQRGYELALRDEIEQTTIRKTVSKPKKKVSEPKPKSNKSKTHKSGKKSISSRAGGKKNRKAIRKRK
ncbi:DEAD/DEAH box helicase [Marinicella sp. S1101]|uniref:DEAD/DEAH box helicase n=1 Tax=Marinicella marina TaxID=2996016 RepID=UPI002260DCE1|nr:DEAD/DEAH box helicase [Marinicella marina]MCX7553738.1 DEAD/DEAH box helicase [Marinicella marina]MDJ1140813.1 DEAD/DEAH box helicase [Marinicella marina]